MLLGGDHTSGTPISQEGMDDQALLQRVIRTVYGPQPFNIPREIDTVAHTIQTQKQIKARLTKPHLLWLIVNQVLGMAGHCLLHPIL